MYGPLFAKSFLQLSKGNYSIHHESFYVSLRINYECFSVNVR